jgi:hypothetical protein
MTTLTKDKPNPWWVTGLVDGEGCFYADLSFRTKVTSSGRSVQCVELVAEMAIALRADDRSALEKVQSYFGCGVLQGKRSSRNSPSNLRAGINPQPQFAFKIRKVGDLVNLVIPHFEAFPLQTKKSNDFVVWEKIVEFAATELKGYKGWLRRHPEKVDELGRMCADLKEARKYRPQAGLN